MSSFMPRYLRCPPEARAPWGILTGDPARLDLLWDVLDDPMRITQEREFGMIFGRYQGERMLGVSTGIGAPALAIVLEELRHWGVQAVVRAGTMMAIDAKLGDFILAWGAVRMEGTSQTYLPLSFPAVADPDLYYAFRAVLKEARVPYQVGLVATSDGFYSVLLPARQAESCGWESVSFLHRHGILGADMETSALYIIGFALGIRCVSLCVATVDGSNGGMLGEEERKSKERQLIQLALDGMLRFAQDR
jgi:uridine phosphorylase